MSDVHSYLVRFKGKKSYLTNRFHLNNKIDATICVCFDLCLPAGVIPAELGWAIARMRSIRSSPPLGHKIPRRIPPQSSHQVDDAFRPGSVA